MNYRGGDGVHQMGQSHISFVCRQEHLNLCVMRINEITLRPNLLAKTRLNHLETKINCKNQGGIEKKFSHYGAKIKISLASTADYSIILSGSSPNSVLRKTVAIGKDAERAYRVALLMAVVGSKLNLSSLEIFQATIAFVPSATENV